MSNHATHQTKRSRAIDNIIKDIRNLSRLEKKKDNDIKDIRTLFEPEEDYY